MYYHPQINVLKSYFSCLYVYVCVWAKYLRRSEEAVRVPEVGDPGRCEPPSADARIWTWILGKNSPLLAAESALCTIPNPIPPPSKYFKCQLWFQWKSRFSKKLLTDAHTGTSAGPQITSGRISATLLTSTSTIWRALCAESQWRGGDMEDMCSDGTWD